MIQFFLACWSETLGAIFVLTIALALYRTIRFLFVRHSRPLVPPAIRVASHALANESMMLKAGLRRIAKADDPITALVNAMQEAAQDGHDKRGSIRP